MVLVLPVVPIGLGKAVVEETEPTAGDLRDLPASMKGIDYTSDLRDFADTAALIQNLDLVISVDTSVAHLAGAMGKPVWNMLFATSDWRWMLEREDSPWYPTMRLFRQHGTEDWSPVIERMAESLRECKVQSAKCKVN